MVWAIPYRLGSTRQKPCEASQHPPVLPQRGSWNGTLFNQRNCRRATGVRHHHRLVIGIQYGPLSEHLQLDPDLLLKQAKKWSDSGKLCTISSKLLKEPVATHKSSKSCDQKVLGPTQWRGNKAKLPKPKQQQSHRQQQKQCTRCGKGQHPQDKCPAKETMSHCCRKKGHYSTQCFTKDVSELTDQSHLDTVPGHSVVHPWVFVVSQAKAVWTRNRIQVGHWSQSDINLRVDLSATRETETRFPKQNSVWAITSPPKGTWAVWGKHCSQE